MFIIKYRNLFFALTGAIVVLSFTSILIFGLHLGYEFTGGTVQEARYVGAKPEQSALSAALDASGLHGYSLREIGTNGFLLRAGNLSDGERAALPAVFSQNGKFTPTITSHEAQPILATEARNKAFLALGLVLIAILLFIAFAFRKVSKPVSSWVYGLIALVTLVHDVIIPVGFFAFLGHLVGVQVDTLFVTAVLTVLGFSIHDTIVVFDRVRENLRVNQEYNRKEDFEITTGRSLQQTFVRSVNTSLTVLITLLILFLIGPASTRDFALTLLVGIIAGTYSSIFLATPLLVTVERWRAKK